MSKLTDIEKAIAECEREIRESDREVREMFDNISVSYTHLTLPTID